MSGSWQHRVHPPSGAPQLSQVQSAVQNLTNLLGLPPNGKARVVFQAVADVALLGTVMVSGTLATVHLYRTLSRRHKEDKHAPGTATGNGAPPHHRGPHVTTTFADGQDGHEERVHHTREAGRGR